MVHAIRGAFFHAVPEAREHLCALDVGIHFHEGVAEESLLTALGALGSSIVDIEVAPVEADNLAAFQKTVQPLAVSTIGVACGNRYLLLAYPPR